jgi:hypothetical protein
MRFNATTIFEGSTHSDFHEVFSDLISSLSGISESKIESYFTNKAVGAKSKSLASTVRTLLLNDLQFKGWEINWSPFKGNSALESAIWNFDAAKQIEIDNNLSWITVEISFDNRVAVGTHLTKSTVANNVAFREISGGDPISHHCLVTATKHFKEMAGIDNSVASSEEFISAAGPYAILNPTRTTLVSLQALETIEIAQRKSEGRTKSRLLNTGNR